MGLDIVPAALIVGLCFAITSLPIVTTFLRSLGITDTKMGHLIMGSSIVIEIVVLMCMGIIFDMEQGDKGWAFVQTFVFKTIKMGVFFIAVMLANQVLRSKISRAKKAEAFFTKLISYLGSEAIFGLGVIFVLAFSTFSEILGFHFIIGAFFGGLLLNKDIIGTDAFHKMNTTLGAITRPFLSPILFSFIGLHFSLHAFNKWDVLIIVIAAGFISKLFGAWLGGRLAMLSNKESIQISIILNSRGMLDLVVAELAYSKKYIDADVFSMLVFLSLSSVILNPIMYKRFVEGTDRKT